MKKILALTLVMLLIVAIAAACGNSSKSTAANNSGGAGFAIGSSGAPELSSDAAQRAKDAYAFIEDLREQASAYNTADAKYRYILNCFDPAASASGKFLYAWSDAVLVATKGDVYIDIGVSNAYSTGGTMVALDEMIDGSIDFNFTLPCYYKGYMPLTLAIQNPSLGIKNATVASYAMWELYKNNADIQAEFADDGVTIFLWANNPSPLSYKGAGEITSIADIKGNIRGNNGPAQIFIDKAGASVYSCPIGDVYTSVSTGVINYLITDWHAIMSFSLFDEGVLNHYLDTNIGCSAYTLMANKDVWAKIVADGYGDAIMSVSGDYCLNLIGIWEEYEANGRAAAAGTGGTIYKPNDALAADLDAVYTAVAEQWIADTGGSAQQVYDKAVELVNKYNGIYG